MVNRRLWFPNRARPASPLFELFGDSPPATAPVGPDEAVGAVNQAEDRGATNEAEGKRLLFINQYYWPDNASTAQHLTDLTESLTARGYECHVLCSQSRYKAGEIARPNHEVHHGVHIHRVPATSMGRRNTWTRMADYLSFYARAAVKAVTLPRFDAVITLTTPPIIGLVGTILRKLKKTPHLFWSMDLHPDASLALKRMSPGNPVVRGLAWLSDFVYRQADRVIVLGPYMADRIVMKRVRPDRVVTIPVWSRRDEVYPVAREANRLRTSLGLQDKFVAMYSGNLGLAHCFEEFIGAARALRDRDDIVFLFVGGGPRVNEVREAKEKEGLDNIRILEYVPREQLHESLSLADVHLISMRPEMTGIVVPGKLYGIMASARPALFVGPLHCESADTIRRAGCGFTITQGDTEGVIDAITKLAGDLNLAHQMGHKGRMIFLAMHEQKLCCYQWFEAIRNLIGRPRTAASPSPSLSPIPRLGATMTPAGTLHPGP